MVSLLLLLLPAGLVAAFTCLGYGLSTLVKARRRRAGRAMWLRGVAGLLGAVAVAVYTLGLLCLAGAVLDTEDGGAGSTPFPPCRVPGQPERATGVVDYSVDYVPVRFVCETEDGRYSADSVPGFVNPAAFGSGLAAAVCAGAAALGAGGRARRIPTG